MAVVTFKVEIEALEEEIKVQQTVQERMMDPEIDTQQRLHRKAIVDHPGDIKVF